jgi:endonuclease G
MDDFDDLLERATRALGGLEVKQAFVAVRAIIGPERFPEGEDVAQQGMDALRVGKVPSPAQRIALETVIKSLRPSILSAKAVLGKLPAYHAYADKVFPQWGAFGKAISPYLYSVGRIDKVDGEKTNPLATGFVVAPGIVVTNTHVLDAISANTRRLQKGQAVIQFGQEYGVVPDIDPVAITGVVAVHEELDMSLLSIEDKSRPPWQIDSNPIAKARAVAAVGYPQDDPRSPVFREIFQNTFGVKRAAPGEVRGTSCNAVYHDCSTLGGNSGSPLVDMDSTKVVGIHRDGPLFLFRNEAVDGAALAKFVGHQIN